MDELSGPFNLEAEQALLGSILFENEAYHRVPSVLESHFAEPFHGRLWVAIEGQVRRNLLADPVTLHRLFADDPAYLELGGLRYMADLIDRAPPASHAYSYAETIRELSQRRDLVRIGKEISDRATSDQESPASDQIVEAEQDLYRLAETGPSSKGFVEFKSAVRGAIEMAESAQASEGGLVGLSTGLRSLDRRLGGMHRSDLLVLAGRPSMGKTSLATNIAYQVAKNGFPVAFFSLEMSGEQLAMRILSDVSGVSGDSIRRGESSQRDMISLRDASDAISELPIHIDATGGIGISQLSARARRMKRMHGLRLLVIDYLQLITTKSKFGSNRVNEVTEITSGLKSLAKELDIPILALSQLSRAVEQREDKRPQLSDLRESGSIEQDADAVMFVYREAYYAERSQPAPGTSEHEDWMRAMERIENEADIIIAKQRHGPIGTVKLNFNNNLTRFSDLQTENRR